MDLHTVARQEQKPALEISDMVLKAMSAHGLPTYKDSISKSADINRAFERGLAGIRELGEFWIDAQMRSLEVIRSHQDAPLGNAPESDHVHFRSRVVRAGWFLGLHNILLRRSLQRAQPDQQCCRYLSEGSIGSLSLYVRRNRRPNAGERIDATSAA